MDGIEHYRLWCVGGRLHGKKLIIPSCVTSITTTGGVYFVGIGGKQDVDRYGNASLFLNHESCGTLEADAFIRKVRKLVPENELTFAIVDEESLQMHYSPTGTYNEEYYREHPESFILP